MVVTSFASFVRGVTRPGFNTTLLENIVVPLPPVEEQKRIVRWHRGRLSEKAVARDVRDLEVLPERAIKTLLSP